MVIYRPEIGSGPARPAEKEVFERSDLSSRDASAEIKRDVSSLRRVVQPQRDVVGRLAAALIITEHCPIASRNLRSPRAVERRVAVFADRITSLLDACRPCRSAERDHEDPDGHRTIFMPHVHRAVWNERRFAALRTRRDGILATGPAVLHGRRIVRDAHVLQDAPMDMTVDGRRRRSACHGRRSLFPCAVDIRVWTSRRLRLPTADCATMRLSTDDADQTETRCHHPPSYLAARSPGK